MLFQPFFDALHRHRHRHRLRHSCLIEMSMIQASSFEPCTILGQHSLIVLFYYESGRFYSSYSAFFSTVLL
jgi:hypothetical protein